MKTSKESQNIMNISLDSLLYAVLTPADNVVALCFSDCTHITGPPSARVPQNLTVVAGLDVYLRCPVAGFPISSVTWQRAGDILPIHLKQRVFSNGTLLVKHVEGATDKGEYSCSVSNQQGQSAHGRLYLDVMSTYPDCRLQNNRRNW